MLRRLLRLAVPPLAFAASASASAAVAAELLMFEQPGCEWCARWNEEIGGAYALTEEGRRAPLRRVNISEQPLEDVRLASRASYTPTFVLVEDGRELGRIEGYPGPDFFWPLLDRLLKRLPAGSGGPEGG
jgi:thioredoxin-related protein